MIKGMSYFRKKRPINSNNIFEYSDEFLKEICDDLIKLKISNLSNPKSNEFNNKTKQIVGKSFNESEFKDLIDLKIEILKKKFLINLKRQEMKELNF